MCEKQEKLFVWKAGMSQTDVIADKNLVNNSSEYNDEHKNSLPLT